MTEREVLRRIADRQALVMELVDRAAREPSPEVAADLKRLAKSGSELLNRLTSERNSLFDDLTTLEKLRAAPGDTSVLG